MSVTDVGAFAVFWDRLWQLGGIVSSRVFLGKVYGLSGCGH